MPGDQFIEMALKDDRRVLDVLFRHAREAITVQDAGSKLIYANDPAARMIGFGSAEELLKAPVTDLVAKFEIVDQEGAVLSLDRLPGRRVMMGETVVEEVIGYRRPGTNKVRWSRINSSPIKNDAGEVVLAVNFFMDITDQVHRDDALRYLANANEALGGSLDIEENLNTLAKLIVPQLGSWCGVHLIGDDGLLASVTILHPDLPDAEKLVQMNQGERLAVDSDRLPARVVRTKKPEIIREITPEMLEMAAELEGDEIVELIKRLELHSVACLPLRVGSHVIGALSVARSGSEVPFDNKDVEILVAMADRAAVSLENARLYQLEYETSQLLQRGLMPRFLPEVSGLDLAARYRPLSRAGHVGGDFYDVIPLSPDLCALVVGDIEGKGVAAATAVGLARHTVRAVVNVDPTPAVVMGALNSALLEEEQRMCTLAYVLMDRRGSGFELRVSLAGHPPPVIISSEGIHRRIGRPCPPAGVLRSIEPFEELHRLGPGDTLLIYTDGFAVGDQAPPESIERALGGAPPEPLERFLDGLLAYLDTAHRHKVPDDVALLAARVR